jgi:hypothetical protein
MHEASGVERRAASRMLAFGFADHAVKSRADD